MYAVCKNGNCAQTYALDEIIKGRPEDVFMKDIKITKGYRCEKCGGVVVELDGRATLSQYPDVRKFITIEELEKNKKRDLKEAKRKVSEAMKDLKRTEEQYRDL